MNMDNDHYAGYWPLLTHCMNNLGDPYTAKAAYVHSFDEEVKLLDLLAELFGCDPTATWGYITHGSSGSNLHGLYNGRRVLGNKDIVVLSAIDSHYSVNKAADVVGISEVRSVNVDEQGRMSTVDLEQVLSKFGDRLANKNFLLVACSGAVRTGAIDDVDALMEVMAKAGVRRSQVYVHLDAALGGTITPHVDLTCPDIPAYYACASIANPNIDSMSMSFHKRLGLPFPGSAFLTKKSVLDLIPCPMYVECAATFDTTIPGSRNGAIPFMVYHELIRVGESQMRARTSACLEVADYLVQRLTALRNEPRWATALKFAPWHPPGVMCVNVSPPPKHLMAKYHLPLFSVVGKAQSTHILCMEHVQREQIDALLQEWDACLLSEEQPASSTAADGRLGLLTSRFHRLPLAGFGTFK